jgi:hypothetical protein
VDGFWLSLGLIFVAELGDKTQLVALTLATRFKAAVVLAGVCVATLLVHAFSVVLGDLTGKILPHEWIVLLSGLAFLAFGLWTWRGDRLDGEVFARPGLAGVYPGHGPFRRPGHLGGSGAGSAVAGKSRPPGSRGDLFRGGDFLLSAGSQGLGAAVGSCLSRPASIKGAARRAPTDPRNFGAILKTAVPLSFRG